MSSNSVYRSLKWASEAWLTASVHFDALRIAPRPYLTAMKWWILRKRVRARGQLAPLLSRSPKAYTLWALRQDRGGQAHSPTDATRPILALIEARGQHRAQDFETTIASLAAENVQSLLIGSMQTPDLAAAFSQIDWGTGPWFMTPTPGDTIAPGAASAYRTAMNDPDVHLIYSDDDKLGRWNNRGHPHFKPDWNAELFQHDNYLSGACLVRAGKSDLEACANDPDWPTQLVAQAAKRGTPQHLRQILHHRRGRSRPALPPAPIALSGEPPLVSVIVPTRNRVDLLRTCLEGVAATDYPNIEVMVVDNGSDDPNTLAYLSTLDPVRYRVLRHDGPFNFSVLNNRAVADARGDLLCLLNNDIEVVETKWLATMVSQAVRPQVGAVGARLLYPDGRIQHAGVVIGVGNAAGHAHRFVRPEDEGYFDRHNLPQFTMAVTAACLVVKREKYLAVGGLDERNFAVAFNDVDFCLRLNERGWQSLYEPRATLIHHESVSRGQDQDPVGAARFAGELAALKRIWKTDEIVDPFHHPELSRASEQFGIAL